MFKDYFSCAAVQYRQYRPRYPAELFEWLASLPRNHQRAWDCATGNGQAAVALSRHFKEVVATDASRSQVREAERLGNILYAVGLAETVPLPSASLDLVTVAQAAHWFDLSRFYEEATRTLKQSGVLALWTYGLCRISPQIDKQLNSIYSEILGPFWPAERRLVDEKYRTLPFPFREMEAPSFFMREYWTCEHFLMYMSTWSAVGEYSKATGNDPMPRIMKILSEVWQAPEASREIRWPISLRIGLTP